MDGVHKTVAEEVPVDVGHKLDARVQVIREEGATEVHPEVEEAGKVHSHSNNTTSSLSPPEVNHALTISVTPRSFSSSHDYARLKSTKAFKTSIGFQASYQLSCENHPFFEGLHPLPANMKSFYNELPSAEGNIFEACTMSYICSRGLLEELWDTAIKLEGQTASHILPEIISEVADTMKAMENVLVKVD